MRAALRAKFGLDDPIVLRYVRWLVAMVHGDWGFSFASRMNVDTLILQRLPTTLFVIGSSQMLALADRAAGRRLRGDAALFALRPDRQHAGLHRLFAADLLHRPALHPAFTIQLDWLPFVYRADIGATGWRWYWEHFGRRSCRCGARPVPGAPRGRAMCAPPCST